MEGQPWASGPGEILKHGLTLLKNDSDVNRRLAMISIDNAVELMIKTYLGLPERVIGIKIPRKELAELNIGFPALLDGLEKYAIAHLTGINLGEIEWYHRLRNELYHQGNGLTVERNKVVIYSELAKVLFKNLFGFEILPAIDGSDLLGDFLKAWLTLLKVMPPYSLQEIVELGIIDELTEKRVRELHKIRDDIIFGKKNYETVLTPKLNQEIYEIAEMVDQQYKVVHRKLEANADLVYKHSVAQTDLNTLIMEQPRLKEEMTKFKKQIEQLKPGNEGSCPLCGQPLSDAHKKDLLVFFQTEGRIFGDRYRSNQSRIEILKAEILRLEEALNNSKKDAPNN